MPHKAGISDSGRFEGCGPVRGSASTWFQSFSSSETSIGSPAAISAAAAWISSSISVLTLGRRRRGADGSALSGVALLFSQVGFSLREIPALLGLDSSPLRGLGGDLGLGLWLVQELASPSPEGAGGSAGDEAGCSHHDQELQS